MPRLCHVVTLYPMQASKEILTNSLVALKAKPTEEKPAVVVDEASDGEVKAARQKRSVSVSVSPSQV
jgi:hypothetical protein